MGWLDRFKGKATRAAAPAAGWHPAPDRPGSLRWWDGSAWSEHYSDGAARPAEPDTQKPGAASPARAETAAAESTSAPATTEPARSMRRRASGEPNGKPVSGWGKPTVWQNVVGEQHYRSAFATLLRASGRKLEEYGTELQDQAALVVAEPGNRYDANAVAVWVGGHRVGYLGRDTAARYSPALQDLAEAGMVLEVSARVWVAPRGDDRGGSVTVMLPPEDGVQPFNALPEGAHTVLPRGTAIQVTGEERHMDVLGRYVHDRGRHLALTLHLVDEAKTERSTTYRAVEVRLDGHRVGVLTKATSDKLADLVTYVSERGRETVARGFLQGSALRAELTLHVAKSHEVPGRWLERIQPVDGAAQG